MLGLQKAAMFTYVSNPGQERTRSWYSQLAGFHIRPMCDMGHYHDQDLTIEPNLAMRTASVVTKSA